jgi:HSP20 family protein
MDLIKRNSLSNFFGDDAKLPTFDNLFDSFFGRYSSSFAVDIQRKDGEFLIKAELPGLSKEELNVELEHGILTITANKSDTKEEKTGEYIRRESYSGTLQRSFKIPSDVDTENIEASFKDGILSITLKETESQTAKIEITS